MIATDARKIAEGGYGTDGPTFRYILESIHQAAEQKGFVLIFNRPLPPRVVHTLQSEPYNYTIEAEGGETRIRW